MSKSFSKKFWLSSPSKLPEWLETSTNYTQLFKPWPPATSVSAAWSGAAWNALPFVLENAPVPVPMTTEKANDLNNAVG